MLVKVREVNRNWTTHNHGEKTTVWQPLLNPHFQKTYHYFPCLMSPWKIPLASQACFYLTWPESEKAFPWSVCQKHLEGASLVAQWWRIHLSMWEAQVLSLVQDDCTCPGATKTGRHNYWACTLEPTSCKYWGHVQQLLNPVCPRACAPQQEKPLQWEDCTLQLESSPRLPQLEKSLHNNEDSEKPKKKKTLRWSCLKSELPRVVHVYWGKSG